MELTCVTVDCADPGAVARFWGTALGWETVGIQPDGSHAECRTAGRDIYLEFMPVPEGKTVKNRLHLGCYAGPLSQLDAEIARLVALGASVAWEEEFPPAVATKWRNVILRDIEGNEFCLGAGEWNE